MSFLSIKEFIDEGDMVILYLSVSNQYLLEVKKHVKNRNGALVENKFQTIYGVLDVHTLAGKKYGEKIHLPKGWGYILRPTCELWTRNLPHRTQIIYTPDISMILMGLGIKPGFKVVEAGTGSGSLSHSFIRALQPTGHLYTFDFHEQRAQLARQEFESHGLGSWVTVGHRDVVAQGFVDAVSSNSVDAAFLDIPCPWAAITHIQQILKRGSKLCTFSPCIEQVQKTMEALKVTGDFIILKTMEVLQRPMSIQSRTLMAIDFEEGGVQDETNKMAPVKKHANNFKTLVASSQVAGHTGYLTFATFIPANDA